MAHLLPPEVYGRIAKYAPASLVRLVCKNAAIDSYARADVVFRVHVGSYYGTACPCEDDTLKSLNTLLRKTESTRAHMIVSVVIHKYFHRDCVVRLCELLANKGLRVSVTILSDPFGLTSKLLASTRGLVKLCIEDLQNAIVDVPCETLSVINPSNTTIVDFPSCVTVRQSVKYLSIRGTHLPITQFRDVTTLEIDQDSLSSTHDVDLSAYAGRIRNVIVSRRYFPLDPFLNATATLLKLRACLPDIRSLWLKDGPWVLPVSGGVAFGHLDLFVCTTSADSLKDFRDMFRLFPNASKIRLNVYWSTRQGGPCLLTPSIVPPDHVKEFFAEIRCPTYLHWVGNKLFTVGSRVFCDLDGTRPDSKKTRIVELSGPAKNGLAICETGTTRAVPHRLGGPDGKIREFLLTL